ncbi:phosphatase domain-containing protein [Modestobacter sp. KNN46-3]|jgi:phosphatidate phosphatase APP1/phosphatidylserine/phosphatidylglycerophosphate/cardiolipin synthase-like enzyme|uniref:phosphatase domain-containing protein n=1 Tax=Modestobacter sp. KNN46-3 TaxID=2711218 RepID=UPI001F150ACB|nr:phosphatase domain-containing protein [Modestobacter sp. KNN46-3]
MTQGAAWMTEQPRPEHTVPDPGSLTDEAPSRLVRIAYRLENGLRDQLARVARRRGWHPAALSYPGYGASGSARVLGRLLLAPAGTDPGARRHIPGWRRLLTLEQPQGEVEIELGGVRHRARSDDAGLVDVTLDVELPPGRAEAELVVPGREPVRATVHVAGPDVRRGVVCDVDDTVWVTGLRHPLRAAWRTLARSSSGRTMVPGMAGLLTRLVQDHPHAPVVYLSNGPWNLAGPVARFLDRNRFPAGALLMTDWGVTPRGWFRDGRAHKRGALERLTADLPGIRWVLVGDDGEHDPEIYRGFARQHPDRVEAIALRQVHPADAADPSGDVEGVPVVRAPDGAQLAAHLDAALDLPPAAPAGLEAWFLSAAERGNDTTRLQAWTEGNRVRPLVHGRSYLPVLADVLADAGRGDLVYLAGWRGDTDELLTDDGPTVGAALSDAVRRGALVKGLIWRSHLESMAFSAEQNRDLSRDVNETGGEVLLDQRVRPMGSHHQKFVVVRHRDRPDEDVAFLGGIDVAYSRRDGEAHEGDPQPRPFADAYGDTPAWHDVQVELRGPVVREVEAVFRERWEDPAALSRMPWHVLPDLLRGQDRAPSSLPEARPAPPGEGSCAVQLLRTYPNRWPGYPFAPDGERSAARGYAKALARAERLVYVEDQYLWSTDVARVFADALRARPRLQLVVVVPRHPDKDSPLSVAPVALGHARALDMVREAGGDRVQVFDVENEHGVPVYVHAKVCIVDDVWATVGSDNFNRRSWTHDSELTAAVVDTDRDPREPVDPGGHGDGARRFARELRLQLMREHLGRADGDDADLLDPDETVAAVQHDAAALDAWHAGGCRGPRPAGRLRAHVVERPPLWERLLAAPLYRYVIDPDGRPPRLKVRRTV